MNDIILANNTIFAYLNRELHQVSTKRIKYIQTYVYVFSLVMI